MSKMQERDKFNTSCREHSVEITIDHVTRHIVWKRDDCPVCRIISLEQQLQQAHRAGWEQAKREAVKLANTLDKWGDWESDLTDSDLIANAIAAMEYKEPTDDQTK